MFHRTLQLSVILWSVCLVMAPGLAHSQTPPKDLQKKELRELALLETKQRAAKTSYMKSQKNDKLKKTYIALTGKLAYQTMMCLALPPKKKYPLALNLYREVLSVEPGNADARKWKGQIEDIYRSMGRPIPKS